MRYKRVLFVGDRSNLRKDFQDIEDFPYRPTYLEDGMPVVFADSEDKSTLFEQLKEEGYEVVEAK